MSKDRASVTDRLRARISKENRRFIRKNVALTAFVRDTLAKRGWNQNRLASELKKEPSEVSKWLSGSHNLTLESIVKMESVLDIDIIVVPELPVITQGLMLPGATTTTTSCGPLMWAIPTKMQAFHHCGEATNALEGQYALR